MGISTHIYTLWAQHTEVFDDELLERHWEISEERQRDKNPLPLPSIISCGEFTPYTYAGPILFDSGDLRWGPPEGHLELDPTPEKLAELKSDYIENFLSTFPDHGHLVNGVWRLYTIVHLS